MSTLFSATARMLTFVVFAVACTVQAATIHVATTGDDARDGLTWTTAKRTVQAGLNAAQPADQVWVAAGTYDGTITLKAGVALYGGFAGDETDLASRDWTANETVLNGTQDDSVVISPPGATEDTRIDGFTIRNGKGRLVGSNRYGGGIYCYNSSPTIANNTISSNTATDGYGGALCCGACSPVIANNTITGNNAGIGSGIYCWYASPTIENNAIADNGQNASYYSYGGAIYCYGDSAVKILNNTIRGNAAYSGGGIRCENNATPIIANNVITGNGASTDGGGIYAWSPATISNNKIIRNTALSGGGIYCRWNSTISDNVIAGNLARSGGGIYSGENSAIINNTITGNGSDWGDGGGIYCSGWSIVIANTIIAFNSSGVYGNSSYPPQIGYTCVYGNTAYNFAGFSSQVGTNGNTSADPLFIRPTSPGPDFTWGTGDDDYGDLHLQPGSPCIDAGDPAYAPAPGETDMDGQSRVINSRVDIGADEWALAGDSNGDGSVDVVDLLMLVDAWGTSASDAGYDPACDFNHDGLVDVIDLLILVENWGLSGQTVSLSLSGSPMADQAGATATVTATLSSPASADVIIGFTFGGTATKDLDYTASATQIVIPAGQTTGAPITLTLIGNNKYNPARTILLTGQPLSGASYAGSNQVTVDLSGTTALQYKAKGEAWLAQNATQPGVVALPSGLQYKVITPGAGARPDANDRVFVAYTGNLIDGTVFDSNGGVSFGVNEVIPGWTEALQLMPLNAKYTLYIPSNLAYGEPGNSNIPPNAALVFEIELKGIQQIP